MSIFDEYLKPRQQSQVTGPPAGQPESDATTPGAPSEGDFVESDPTNDSGPVSSPTDGDGGFQFETTGNPDVDAILQQKAAEVAKLLSDARKAQSKPAQEQPKQEDAEPKAADNKPPELNRPAYVNHFKSVGSFPDDNAENLAKTVPDVALHAVDTMYRPVIQRFEQTIKQLQDRLAELDGVRSEWSNQQWRGVRSVFGSAADAFKDEALSLSRSKGISLHAALVELNPQFVQAGKQVRQQQANLDNPRALRSAAPANGRPLNGGGNKSGDWDRDESQALFQQVKGNIFADNAARRNGRR